MLEQLAMIDNEQIIAYLENKMINNEINYEIKNQKAAFKKINAKIKIQFDYIKSTEIN